MTRVFVLEMIKANLCWQEYQIEFMKQKAYSLLSTISWIADMSLQNVIFEIDCKQILDFVWVKHTDIRWHQLSWIY